MNDSVRLTSTHSSHEYEGSCLGIETRLFAWVALGFLASLGVFAGLFYGAEFDFVDALRCAVLPVGTVILYLRLVHQGRPPGFTQELLDSLLTGGHAKPNHKIQHPPFSNV